MKRHPWNLRRWPAAAASAGLLLGVVSIGFASSLAVAREAATTDPRRDMIEALGAPAAHPSLAAEARTFDRFAGTWDCDYAFIAADGGVSRRRGEVLFGWIIDGRAMQDIWIGYSKGPQDERTIGTSLRFFDTRAGVWQVIFIGPAYNVLTLMQGGAREDRIVLTGQDGDGVMLRWSFNDIKADSFVWRGETSRDRGNTWRLEEEHHMRRRTAR